MVVHGERTSSSLRAGGGLLSIVTAHRRQPPEPHVVREFIRLLPDAGKDTSENIGPHRNIIIIIHQSRDQNRLIHISQHHITHRPGH